QSSSASTPPSAWRAPRRTGDWRRFGDSDWPPLVGRASTFPFLQTRRPRAVLRAAVFRWLRDIAMRIPTAEPVCRFAAPAGKLTLQEAEKNGLGGFHRIGQGVSARSKNRRFRQKTGEICDAHANELTSILRFWMA